MVMVLVVRVISAGRGKGLQEIRTHGRTVEHGIG